MVVPEWLVIQNEMKIKRALVVEGGAMRGVFAAGMLNIFMERLPFVRLRDWCFSWRNESFNLRVENAWT